MYQISAVSVETSTASAIASLNQMLATMKAAVTRLHKASAGTGVRRSEWTRPRVLGRYPARPVDHAVIAGDHPEDGDRPESVNRQPRPAAGNSLQHLGQRITEIAAVR